MSLQDAESASTNTSSARKKDRSQNRNPNETKRVLSQEELRAWWPFTRLDPKRFPKPKQPEYEDAPV